MTAAALSSHLHDELRRRSLDARALDLLASLQADGPATRADLCVRLGWRDSQFRSALDHAREVVCPELSLTIPHPVPDDGWRYCVTGSWLHDDGAPAIAAGTAYALAVIERRLISVLRDAEVAVANADPQSIPGRKANYLSKHIANVLETLSDIDGRPVAVRASA